jgi:hypothetical protein
VILRLPAVGCHRSEDRRYPDGRVEVIQLPCQVDWSSARLTSPWGRTFAGTESGSGYIGFAVDWASAGIDALESAHPALLTRSWRFSSPEAAKTLEWTPDRAAQQAMLALIGAATGTETEVADITAPPRLVVGEAHFVGDARNGSANELIVTLTNEGFGAAYRVRMVTRSNIPALHGLRLSFGRLRPGEAKTRRARIVLPRDNPEDEAVIVLAFEEAHGHAPEQGSVRAKVLPAIDPAVLAISCRFDGLQGDPPRVDAGTTVHLSCDVRNEGSTAHGVRMHVVYPGQKRAMDVPPFDLAGKDSTRVNIAMDVPREAAIDSELTVQVTLVDDLGVHASTTVPLGIASPKICPNGRITREQFLDKRAALRKKHDAGLISDEDYKRYEDELVGCMAL